MRKRGLFIVFAFVIISILILQSAIFVMANIPDECEPQYIGKMAIYDPGCGDGGDDPRTVCGNGICEFPEENNINCQEDCECEDCGCINECTPFGLKECQSTTQYRTCGNFDADSCYEWGVNTCPSGTTCSNGICGQQSTCNNNGICEWPPENIYNCPNDCQCTDCNCEDECSYGQRRCVNGGYEVCGNHDSDSCLEWGPSVNCPENTNCQDGVCIYEPECTIQQFTAVNGLSCQSPRITWQTYNCDNVNIYLDRSYNPLDYSGSDCPNRFLYASGQSGNNLLDFMMDGYEAGQLHSCTAGNTNSISAARFILEADGQTRSIIAKYSGTCTQQCTNDCTLGTRECTDTGYRMCGNYDSDTCTEWGSDLQCSPTTTCSNGFCIPGPSPESPVWTPIPQQYIRCEETFTSINLNNFIYDPDTSIDNLTFVVSGGLNLIPSLDPATNIVTFTMTPDRDFVEVITFIARDPDGNTATIRVTFIRQGCNSIEPPGYSSGPRITAIPSQTVRCGDDFQELDLDNFAYDPDGDNLTFFVYGGVYIQPDLGTDNVVEFEYDDDDLDVDIMERLIFRVTDEDGQFAEYTSIFKVVDCEDVIIIEPQEPGVCKAKKYAQNSNIAIYLDDADCDNIPDIDDNCMMIPNFDQADYNGNGIGDKCDLVVSRFEFEPSKLDAGRTTIANVELSNLMIHDVENIKLTIDIPKLKIKAVEYVDFLGQERQESTEFILQTDNCIEPGQYEATLTVKYLGRDTTVKKAMVTILSDKYCAGPVLLNSDINVYELQDVKLEETAIYPIEIKNDNPISKQYVLSVDGVEKLGAHAFTPSNVLVLAPGQEERVDLLLTPYANSPLGEQNFMLNIQSDKEKARQYMVANIEENEWKSNSPLLSQLLGYLLTLIVIGFMIFLAVFLYRQIKDDKKAHPENFDNRPLVRDEISEIRELDEFLDDYSVENLETQETKSSSAPINKDFLSEEEAQIKKDRKDIFKEFDK